jgi:hypothetical protein
MRLIWKKDRANLTNWSTASRIRVNACKSSESGFSGFKDFQDFIENKTASVPPDHCAF